MLRSLLVGEGVEARSVGSGCSGCSGTTGHPLDTTKWGVAYCPGNKLVTEREETTYEKRAWMTATEFKRTLKRLRLSYARFADIVETDVRTVNRWASGETPVRPPIAMLLRIWYSHPETRPWDWEGDLRKEIEKQKKKR